MCALTEKVCDALNEGLKADPGSIQWLVDRRKLMVEDFPRRTKAPFVCGGARGKPTLGPLGLINMVLIKAGCVCGASARYEYNKLVGFRSRRFPGTKDSPCRK